MRPYEGTQGMRRRWFLMILALWLIAGHGADDEAQLKRIDQAVRSMLISLAGDPLFADFSPEDWDLLFTRAPERIDSFGLILSPRHDRSVDDKGLPVLGVTPGSAAMKLGIRSGDRIGSINGAELVGLGDGDDGHSNAYRQFDEVTRALEDGAPLQLEVVRDGRAIFLEGRFQRLYLPGATLHIAGQVEVEVEELAPATEVQPCATIRTRPDPPHSYDLHPVQIQKINGEQAGATLRDLHYLAPGRYTLTLEEQIPGHLLKMELQRFRERRPPLDLTVELATDMEYYLGARLIANRREQSRDEPYWEPVVWRMEPGRCRGKVVER